MSVLAREGELCTIEAADGHFYVVKFLNNPQHRRILVNEWISAVFLRYLQISVPATAIVNLSPEFLAANTGAYVQLGSKRVEIEPGWHFGSAYPGDPARTAVPQLIAAIEQLGYQVPAPPK